MLLVESYKLCSIFTPPPEIYALFIVYYLIFHTICVFCILYTLLFGYNKQ